MKSTEIDTKDALSKVAKMANDNDSLGKAIFGIVGGIVVVIFACCIALGWL